MSNIFVKLKDYLSNLSEQRLKGLPGLLCAGFLTIATLGLLLPGNGTLPPEASIAYLSILLALAAIFNKVLLAGLKRKIGRQPLIGAAYRSCLKAKMADISGRAKKAYSFFLWVPLQKHGQKAPLIYQGDGWPLEEVILL
jgi:hypothetical protein